MKAPERTAVASQAHVCLSVCLCSAATQLKSKELSLPEGKVRVKLDHDGAILDVDEEDVEKVCGRLVEGTRGAPCRAGQAVCWHGQPDLLLLRCPPVCPILQANAPSCDRLEDLASLVYLNESSVLHTLRQRYGASLLHTYAGPSLLVLSPRGAPAVYSEKVRPHRPTTLYLPASPTFPGPASSTWHPTGLLSTLTVTLGTGVTSRDGDRSRTTTTTSHRGQDLTSICTSMYDLSLRTFWLLWSEKPRKVWVSGVRAVHMGPAKSAHPFFPSLSHPR